LACKNLIIFDFAGFEAAELHPHFATIKIKQVKNLSQQ